MTERQQVLYGRLFVAGVLIVTYVIAQVSNRSIFALGVWSFTGFASLFPVVAAAVFWKRSTKYGAFASIASVAVLWTYFFTRGWQTPGYTLGDGIMPVAVILAVSAAAMVVGSLATRPPDRAVVDRFIPAA
jgi:SSS family solute:Na+ symporter